MFAEHEIRCSPDRQPDRISLAFGRLECKRDIKKPRLTGKWGKASIL